MRYPFHFLWDCSQKELGLYLPGFNISMNHHAAFHGSGTNSEIKLDDWLYFLSFVVPHHSKEEGEVI